MSKVAALLIHAAKIDEDFSKSEEVIIKQALLQIGADNENLEKILSNGKKIEVLTLRRRMLCQKKCKCKKCKKRLYQRTP